ncbi:uncharacterized protein LOC115759270 [Drosophila novamexicana]|uniref:uncharacterized protein LOC115759270 n=1 Tax=Drosophila novamexicana TaxID=47314 RepID=UPI0011E5C760|nr:uncharacterized protein LOC115759270 [Drosophila novamexicana]
MEKLKTKQQTEARSNGNTRGEPNLKPNSNPNPFKRPMNALQKQWYRVLLARRVGFGQKPTQDEKEPTYADICHRRYMAAFRRYNERFRWEMAMHEQMQRCAIDAMRVHRTFSITMLWLPLHSKREINSTLETLEKVLTVQERRRLEEILKRGESLRTRRF